MDKLMLYDKRIPVAELFGNIVQHLFCQAQLGYLEGKGTEGEQQLPEDPRVVDMQRETQAFEEGDPVRARDVLYPDIVVVPEEDAVQHVEKIVLRLKRRQ